MSSLFCPLFLVPLHSFVQDIVSIFRFIIGTTAFSRSLISSLFYTLLLVPLHSFVLNVVFILHLLLGPLISLAFNGFFHIDPDRSRLGRL